MVHHLSYSPPFNFDALLGFYKWHQIGNLESYDSTGMTRVFECRGVVGEIRIENRSAQNSLEVTFLEELTPGDPSLPAAVIGEVLRRVRELFDLDADIQQVSQRMERDPGLKILIAKHSGIRLPSGWDPFEIAIATILGQLVSLAACRSLVSNLIETLGKTVLLHGREIRLFPLATAIAESDLSQIGTTRIRKRTLQEFCRAIIEGRISFDPHQDPAAFMKDALAIYGIGIWSASYMAMKCLRHADAFPRTDLILARAIELHPEAESMEPYRGYVAALLWREYAGVLKKPGRPV